MARGIHTKPNEGITTEWLTPPEIIESIGPFSLDPCAHPQQPWNTADRMIAPPDDGLSHNWVGRVWLNPPFGSRSSAIWLKRMAEHGCGTALVAARTEVESWFVPYIWKSATAVLFIFGRLYYCRSDGTRANGNAGHGSALVAYGNVDAARLLESNIEGQFVYLGNRG